MSEVIDAAYELLSFEPGAEPNWFSFNECFQPLAVLALRVFPEDLEISVLSLPDYARAQMRNGLQEAGYTETPGAREIVTIGAVAMVKQEFTMNFAGLAPVSAVDLFSLACVANEWRIVSVVSDTTDHAAEALAAPPTE